MPYLDTPTRSGGAPLRIHYQLDDFTDPWLNRPYLVLQHGNGRSGDFWYRWAPMLATHFKLVRPDMRGVGRSDPVTDPEEHISIEACVNDLVRLIDHLTDQPVYVCGESMGGILGMLLAAQHPGKVRALSLVATPAFINDSMKSRYALGYASRLEAMRGMGIREWVRQTSVLTRFAPDTDPRLIDWYVDEFAKGTPEVLVRYADLVSSANAVSHLRQIHCPTLALFPRNGQITDDAQVRIFKEEIAGADVRYVDSEYHMIHLTHAQACAEAVRDFFLAHDQG
ncbi:alpha/beta fold hydrolase [Hydrogenophaga sp.]|uniref:alpha/beta fold hydrolase n=1 Tax=Hydrogenophaga sp. TaxID=1904254 RepID=UPI002721E8BD|nr:alpha/beta hydrolase [Hydrogenophaga sp.]MDO9435481.1 alpha/beta hydrolase [Hydrogenophaga sp.]